MSDQFVTKLRLLFEINAARQAEIDELFRIMPNYPSNNQLTLLHDTVDHSVPEAHVLMDTITEFMHSPHRRIPTGMLSKMLMHKAILHDQIKNDHKLTVYLEKEYNFLAPQP